MHTDETLSAADQRAGPILCYVRVRQLSLPAVIRLASLGVETHFRDEWFGPLAAPWMVHQRHTGTPTTGLGLGSGDICYTWNYNGSLFLYNRYYNTNEP